MTRTGVLILDDDRRLVVVSPVAEDLLGWRARQVTGMDCRLVLDCRDSEGASLCANCGADRALTQREMTPTRHIQMADATGGYRAMNMTFWYLPPSGFIYQPRVMAVFDAAAGAPNSATVEASVSERERMRSD